VTERVAIPAQTAELRRRWLTLTIAAAVVAASLPVVAGGPGLWVHLLMGAGAVAGFVFAALRRRSLVLPVTLALLSVLLVADTAHADRAVLALPVSIAVLLAVECATVTRRLDTVAPVDSTAGDAAAVTAIIGVAVVAGLVVAALAQLDRFGHRALAAGVMIALGLLGILLRGHTGDAPGERGGR
jgi:hypothetical protein